jgi:hypothetical protein
MEFVVRPSALRATVASLVPGGGVEWGPRLC